MRSFLTLLTLTYFLSMAAANAQIGVHVGAVAVPDYAFISSDSAEKVSGAIGYTVGVFYKHWITDHISLQPALNVLNKRWWEELDDGGAIYITRISMNYLELPVQVVYTTNKTKGFFVGVGPSVMVGLGGKRTVTEDGDLIMSNKLKLGSESAPEKKLTLAVNAMAGYAYKHFSIGLNYTRGITNQPVGDADHGNVSNINLKVGYLFGKQ